ncbi:MAG: hypothetical protein JNK60_11240, partial [Acidobacteria bacterium]|nr:hypothetical protein [Acidobacteriota bacterium]
MTHRLFVGPFAALEERLLAEIATLKGSDPLAPVDVLVGSNLLGVYLRRLVATRQGAVANLRLLTFVDLARETGAQPVLPPLPALATLPLARAALLESHGAEVFGPLRTSRALARALATLADDLASAGLSLRDLSLLPEAAGSAERRSFLAGLAATLKTFEASRAAFTTPHSIFAAAAASSAGAPRHARPLLVYGVSDLTGLHRALLSALAGSRSLVAFVPRTTADAAEVFPKVRQALFEELLGVSAHALDAQALEAPLAARPTAVLANDERDEAREVVREVLRAAADGIPLHRMAVLLRHPESQEPGLLAELGRHGIPYFRPPGKGAAKSPLGRLALLLLALAEEDLPAPLLGEAFDLLETEGLLGARAADLAETREKLEVLAGRTAWEARLARDTSTHREAFQAAFTRVV